MSLCADPIDDEDVIVIDLEHAGRDRVIAAYLDHGVIIDPGPASCAAALRAGLDGREVRAVVLTHVHLDHAGGVGHVIAQHPRAKVYVHELGARHVVDPRWLYSSAERVWGPAVYELFGRPRAVPADNVVALSGGERIEGLRSVAAPGHAKHHIALLSEVSGAAYVGDLCGVRIPPARLPLPPTPPPDIDVRAWRRSIDAVRQWGPSELRITHFGIHGDVDQHLDEVDRQLLRLAKEAGRLSEPEFTRGVLQRLVDALDEDQGLLDRYRLAGPPEHFHAGLVRDLQRRRALGQAGTPQESTTLR